MTQDRLSALQQVKADALALADKAKALGLDAATVDSLAATVSAGLTEAAVKARAPDSWRVTVRRWALVPVDQVFEVIGATAYDAGRAAMDDARANSEAVDPPFDDAEWDEASDGGSRVQPIKVEPVWQPVAAPVEPELADPDFGNLPLNEETLALYDEVEPVKVDGPVRIGPEPIPPAPKDDGIYEAVAVRSR